MVQKSQKTIETTLNKAIAIISGAVLVGVVGGLFAGINILNTDHFVLINNSNAIERIEKQEIASLNKNKLDKAEFDLQITNLNTRLDNIQDGLNTLLRLHLQN
jgi:hypothetical protein